jgi:hypothetical protein
MRSSLRRALAALLLLPAGAAHAYSLRGDAWPGCPAEVHFSIDTTFPVWFTGSTGSSAEIEGAFATAIEEWQSTTSAVSLVYDGPVTTGGPGVIASHEVALADWTGELVTVTLVGDPVITSCEVTLDYYYSTTLFDVPPTPMWDATDPPTTGASLHSAYLYAIGACLGLDSVTGSGQAMSVVTEGVTTSVTSDDADGLRAIYGACADDDGDGSTADLDCDDGDASVHPGATESCNGIDDDCDGAVDEGGSSTWYADADGDGYGDPAVSTAGCAAPAGYVADATDCAPGDAAIHPTAGETCDGIDEDCDGTVDDGFDRDADGVTSCAGDCDDDDPTVNPEVAETCDGRDEDCDGTVDDGFDVDADGVTSCAGDCNDTDPRVSPRIEETCNAMDDDCDGTVDNGFDHDADGLTTCIGDCDDEDPSVNFSAVETCDGRDEDCDGTIDNGFDRDADGFTSCAGDCDDDDPTVNPAVDETCNSRDDDCDGETDEGFDADADSFTSCEGDCDDIVPEVHPGADETCNSRDDDCDGEIDEGFIVTWYDDADGDGFGDPAATASGCQQPVGYVARPGDCDDGDSHVHPGETDTTNGIDADCDGVVAGGTIPSDTSGCASTAPGAGLGPAALLGLLAITRRAKKSSSRGPESSCSRQGRA